MILSNGEIIVVKYNGIIIGAATLLIEQKFIHDCAKYGHIEDVIVSKNFRKNGIGKILIETIIAIAKDKGCYKITLCCSDDNYTFYSKCGFEKSEIQMIMLM
jgi:glucosamine-phosphate N-acetyltransferase